MQFVAGHGDVDIVAILTIVDRLNDGDPITEELVKSFAEDGTEDYYPNLIAVKTAITDAASPYAAYLDVCEAYDAAVLEGAKEELNILATGIRGEGES